MLASLSEFAQGYVRAMLWSGCDDDGEPLDLNYTAGDLSAEAIDTIARDCGRFEAAHGHQWEHVAPRDYGDGHGEWSGAQSAGADFWLTRNGHGVGFRELKDLYGQDNAGAMDAAARAFGACDVYVGDDGLLHLF